ncbi:hypothetical protein OBBRIDRAFT_805651 [Obba rivulosa]|uniref:Uncharacterized protein n=1 Tax=Obba rivulosa TaxID=1052685 RepID=A0A8E2APK0_9APHY|nr:hypothetical protein OBBRIDRAFT_805651 [Obba rivulosa]
MEVAAAAGGIADRGKYMVDLKQQLRQEASPTERQIYARSIAGPQPHSNITPHCDVKIMQRIVLGPHSTRRGEGSSAIQAGRTLRPSNSPPYPLCSEATGPGLTHTVAAHTRPSPLGRAAFDNPPHAGRPRTHSSHERDQKAKRNMQEETQRPHRTQNVILGAAGRVSDARAQAPPAPTRVTPSVLRPPPRASREHSTTQAMPAAWWVLCYPVSLPAEPLHGARRASGGVMNRGCSFGWVRRVIAR